MNEAPKLKQLLKVVEKRNPNWYPFIHGYLNGELPNLELDQDQSDLELGEQQLFMGNYDSCVVAEPFGFKGIYKHDEFENCFICARYSEELCTYSGRYNESASDSQRKQFASTLEQFYKHRGFMK